MSKSAKDIVKDNLKRQFPGVDIEDLDLDFSLVGIKYADLQVSDLVPQTIQTSTFLNDSDALNSQSFVVSKQTTDSFTWSITEGVELGTTFKISIPFFTAEEASIKLNFSSTQQQSTTVTRKWDFSAQVGVPPRSTITASFVIREGKVQTPWTATFMASGKLEMKLDDKHKTKLKGKISELIGQNGITAELFQVTVTGQLTGSTADDYQVETHQQGVSVPKVISSGSVLGKLELGKAA